VKKTAAFKLIIATPVFMLLANYLAIFAQDYAHSITAWFLGYKEHPFNIYFGGRSILNFLVLFNANDNVDYDLIMSAGRMRDLAYIGLAGIGLANGALYFISLRLMKIKLVQHFQLFFYFIHSRARIFRIRRCSAHRSRFQYFTMVDLHYPRICGYVHDLALFHPHIATHL